MTAKLEDLRVYAWQIASLPPTSLLALEAEIGSVFGWSQDAAVATCQRYEVITLAPPAAVSAHHTYAGRDALLHLARLAAGLESLVLGETEVMGQVRRSLASAGSCLRRVVAPAIAAARLLRREAAFQTHAGHALDMALALAGVAPAGSLLVVGGGPMGRRVAERGAELGFQVTLVARRPLPLPRSVQYQPFSKLAALPPADVLVTCLGRGAPQMGSADLPPVRRLAVDFGTPRNLKPELKAPVVRLADLLTAQHHDGLEPRRQALEARLRDLLDAQVAMAQPGSPLGELRQEVERIRRRELLRTLRLHPELPPDKLDAITRSLVNQIFHRPSLRLRRAEDPALMETVAALFRARDVEEEDEGR